jgi:hypothetical protein
MKKYSNQKIRKEKGKKPKMLPLEISSIKIIVNAFLELFLWMQPHINYST